MRGITIAILLLLLSTAAWWWLAASSPTSPRTEVARVGDANVERAPAADLPTKPLAEPSVAAPADDQPRQAVGDHFHGQLLQRAAPLGDVTIRVLATKGESFEVLANTTTHSDGRFMFAMPREPFVLFVEGETVPRHWATPLQIPHVGDWQLGELHVPTAGGVDITVRDRNQQAIAGAHVRAATSDWRAPSLVNCDPALEATADQHGIVHFERLCPGGWHLDVDADGWRSGAANVEVIADSTQQASVALWPTSRHTGVVLDWRNAPLPGASVASTVGHGQTTTDAHGWFALDDTGNSTLSIGADGHLPRFVGSVFGNVANRDGEHGRIRLQRAVTLHGVVRGAAGAVTTVTITDDPDSDRDAEPYALLNKPLPVATDGTFVIEGLAEADLLVQAQAAGVGTSAALRVALRGDIDGTGDDNDRVELVIDTGNSLRVLVTDELGAPLDGAELVIDPRVVEYPGLYRDDYHGVLARILTSYRKQVCKAERGVAMLPRDRGVPFACAASMPGHLATHCVLAADEAPAEITLVLRRAGAVQGIVHEGIVPGDSATEHTRSISLWRVDQEAAIDAAEAATAIGVSYEERAAAPQPRHGAVDADGRFAVDGLEPGAWRIALSRGNPAKRRSNDASAAAQAGLIPLLDEGTDRREVIDCEVLPDAITTVELTAAQLGTLRGRVLLRSVPCGDVQVFAVRPAWRSSSLLERGEAPDWDDEFVRNQTASQQVAADGSFVLRYRDAGPVELRLRHIRGAATQAPIVIELPPPGADVVHDLPFAAGAIRGRFALEQLPERDRGFVSVVLYPPHKATDDPSFSTDWTPGISWRCSKIEFAQSDDQGDHNNEVRDGRFAFDFLPDGEWLVRVQQFRIGNDPGPLWQRLVLVEGGTVVGGIVDLGELTPPPRITAQLHWRWHDEPAPGRLAGVWLYQTHGTLPAIWAGTFANSEQSLTLCAPAGRYTVVPFGALGNANYHLSTLPGLNGLTGTPLAPATAIELHADGSITPAELVFASPAEHGK